MTINKFVVEVSKIEGLKKQVNIAQIREVLKAIDKVLVGLVYKLIRQL